MQNNCPSCGKDNAPGVAYCQHCGEPIGRYEKLVENVRDIEETPSRYGTLRFISDVMGIIGWIVIIGWAVVEILMYTVILGIIQGLTKSSTGIGFDIFSSVMMLLTWMPGLLIGFSIIASGQIMRILIDIRNDAHTTRRYVRRFGLYMAKDDKRSTQPPNVE